jgi:DNA replication factor GINS
MQLEGLRLIVLQERETGKLSEIPPDLFATTSRQLEELQKQVYAAVDPLGVKERMLAEEIQNIQESLKDIFRLRFGKILTLALVQVDSNYADREERKRMLPEERTVFDTTVEALRTCRAILLEGSPREEAGKHPAAEVVPEGQLENFSPADQPGTTVREVSYSVVRVIADVDPFMGVDGRGYRLRKGDIASIPSGNAVVLCERNIVLNMNIGI